jgi:hypothetical protein
MSLLVVACSEETPAPAGSILTVTDGTDEKTYTVEDLERLETSQADFLEVSYAGVKLSTLLRDAGFDPESASAVKATAEDGFTANYEPELVNRDDTLVAYARVDGPLAEDDGYFRMVLPDQEGKLNPRHLVEIRVYP